MNFNAGMAKAYSTKWSFINSFRVQFLFNSVMKQNVNWTSQDEDDMNLYIKSIDTPEYSNQGIQEYIGDQWKIHNGRNEMFTFSITFRDYDNLTLYRKFIKTYQWQKTLYYSQCKTGITIFKEGDYSDQPETMLYNLDGCMIDSISQLQFSNETDTQIVEFTIKFKCPIPEVK